MWWLCLLRLDRFSAFWRWPSGPVNGLTVVCCVGQNNWFTLWTGALCESQCGGPAWLIMGQPLQNLCFLISVLWLHTDFYTVLSIWLTIDMEEIACTSLKVTARVVWLCCSDIPHSICSSLKQGVGYPASDLGNETEYAELIQLPSCRFPEPLSMLYWISLGSKWIEVRQRWNWLAHPNPQLQLVLTNIQRILPTWVNQLAFSFPDLAFLPEN